MALIKCPECEKDISDKAKVCIHCGYPIAEHVKMEHNIPSVESPIDTMEQQEIEKYNMLGDELRADEKYLAAMDYYIKAADLGSTHAQVWIGNMYNRGLGVGVNHAEAAKWYQKAAEQENTDALSNLALLYKNGAGVVKNFDKAIELNMRAIRKGSAIAAGNLGMLYEYAPEGIQSIQLARKYYEEAISLGTTQYAVYNNVALIYAEGKGTSVNYAKAEQYYLKAIALGSEQAKKNYAIFANDLGVMYANGKGVEKNYAKAEKYLLDAIKFGNEQAKKNYGRVENNLGVMYADGDGVSPNYAKAEEYYLKAIEFGNEQAKSNYESLRKQKGAYKVIQFIDKKEQEFEQKAQEKEKWRQRLTRTCPRCGRHTGHPINETYKKMSISFWGYYSDKWGKSYKCDACDYMW